VVLPLVRAIGEYHRRGIHLGNDCCLLDTLGFCSLHHWQPATGHSLHTPDAATAAPPAPEALLGALGANSVAPPAPALDMWALGCLCVALGTGQPLADCSSGRSELDLLALVSFVVVIGSKQSNCCW
jgi:hypothetical protein